MNAPAKSKAIVASRFGYPFKDKQEREITDPQALYEGLSFVQGGHYLLGAHGFFHGGIHLDRSCSNAFSLDQGIRCLADGEVVAYRINREYLDATNGTPGDGPTLRPYSTGFVLVRHRLQAPTPPQPDKPAPMDHPMADARNMGTYLYSDPEGRQRARWLRHGTPLTVEIGKYAPGRRYLRVLGIGEPGTPATGWISPTWLALDPAAGTSLFNVLGFKDQVSTYVRGGDHPDPERMAAYSQNQAERARPAPAPAPTLTLYSLYMHLADFADYRAQSKWQRPGWWSAPQYRVGDKAKDQQAEAAVHAKVSRSVGLNIREEPSGKSVILGLLPRGTCIETGERSSNGKWARISKVVAGEIDSPVAGSHVPVGALNGWVYLGELMADTRPEAFDSVVVLDQPAARQRNVMTRIAELLGPGAVEQVEAEAPRAGRLPWWDEVAASVDGFPKAPRVYHFHPGGVAGNYIAPALDDLKVSRGQVTFDAEGNDAPGSAYFSRRLHWPGGASGVTLGRGYDMKHRTQEAVHADLVSAGVDESSARDFAQGAGLAGQAAQRFVSTHREEFGEISRTAQRILFESIVYPRYEEAAQRQYREAAHENANLMAWEQLDVRVRDSTLMGRTGAHQAVDGAPLSRRQHGWLMIALPAASTFDLSRRAMCGSIVSGER